MVNVFQMEMEVLIVYVCKVLVDQDVNQDHRVQATRVKMEVYVYLPASVIDVIVHQALQAIIVKQKTFVQIIHAKMEVNVDHRVVQ